MKVLFNSGFSTAEAKDSLVPLEFVPQGDAFTALVPTSYWLESGKTADELAKLTVSARHEVNGKGAHRIVFQAEKSLLCLDKDASTAGIAPSRDNGRSGQRMRVMMIVEIPSQGVNDLKGLNGTWGKTCTTAQLSLLQALVKTIAPELAGPSPTVLVGTTSGRPTSLTTEAYGFLNPLDDKVSDVAALPISGGAVFDGTTLTVRTANTGPQTPATSMMVTNDSQSGILRAINGIPVMLGSEELALGAPNVAWAPVD